MSNSHGMAGRWGMKVVGGGAALPDKVLTNEDLSAFMDTTDEWIHERTGIRERRIGGTTSGLAIESAEQALKNAGLQASDIDQMLLATTTPEQTCPGTSPTVAAALGMTCGALDIQAVCSGWVYGLVMANGLLAQGANRVMLIGSEALDQVTDYHDRGSGILFGNGAGAVIVERSEASESGGELLGWDLGADGNYRDILYIDHGSTWQMDGREVFRQAVKVVQQTVNNTLEMAGVTADDVALAIPHQANVRIVDSAWRKLGLTLDKTAMVIETTGNTSSASIPLALESAVRDGRVNDGDLVLFVGFGAGMTWGSVLLRWQS